MRKRDEKRYTQNVLTILCIGVIALIFILIFTNLSAFTGAFSALTSVLSSLMYGIVFAFLLNPLVNFVDRRLLPLLLRKGFGEKGSKRFSRITGMVFAFAMGTAFVYALVSLIVPQLVNSIKGIVAAMPSYYENIELWVESLLEDNPSLREFANMVLEKGYEFLNNFVKNDLLGNLQKLTVTLANSVFAIVRELVNMLIGVIISIYILLGKDKFQAQAKKMVVAYLHPESANHFMENGRRINRIFNGFIIGKLLDSLIIGILCYIGMVILRMPYAVLLATIVGVTNIIPYFGPFIGAVPCALLILLVSPIKCFYFIVFILILQQLDGNVIGPRILSDNVGIGGFWILLSITVGSGLFGFGGMLLGVPVFAIIYMLVSDSVSRALRRKNKTTVTEDYYGISAVEDLPDILEPDENPGQTSFDLPPQNEETPPEA